MGFLDSFKGMFSKQQRLDDLDMDDLRKARAKLEREQDRVLHQIDEIEKNKTVLDAQGRAERSARKQKLLAQKILQLESQAKRLDRNLAYFSKQLRIVDGFIFLKENQRVLASTPLGDILARMDTAELQEYVDQATIDGTFQLEKMNALLGIFEEDSELLKADEDDEKIADIVAGWQQAQESEVEVPVFEEPLADMEADDEL